MPCASTSTSCGSVVGRGSAYSVTMTRVARPLGRARVLSGYSHWETALRLTPARYSACLRNCSGLRVRGIEHALRLDRLAHRRVAAHADHDLGPFVGGVGRAHDALERVAAGAVEQEGLLLL